MTCPRRMTSASFRLSAPKRPATRVTSSRKPSGSSEGARHRRIMTRSSARQPRAAASPASSSRSLWAYRCSSDARKKGSSSTCRASDCRGSFMLTSGSPTPGVDAVPDAFHFALLLLGRQMIQADLGRDLLGAGPSGEDQLQHATLGRCPALGEGFDLGGQGPLCFLYLKGQRWVIVPPENVPFLIAVRDNIPSAAPAMMTALAPQQVQQVATGRHAEKGVQGKP